MDIKFGGLATNDVLSTIDGFKFMISPYVHARGKKVG